jgi:hypothetical protein
MEQDSLVLDAPGYIDPKSQDFALDDIDQQYLRDFASDIGYLSEAEFPAPYPVEGDLCGLNNRMMINLVCRHVPSRLSIQQNKLALNVVFLVNTGSPVSYLSDQAMQALSGDSLRGCLYVSVQDGSRVFQFYRSPEHSRFRDVNIIGMDFISTHQMTIDGNAKSFVIVVSTSVAFNAYSD